MATQTKRELGGMIRLFIGPMFSCKTSALLESYTRHSIGQRKCILIKHSSDTRYDVSNIVSHNGRKAISSVVCDLLCEADSIVNDYQVVCIDEVQFFDDAPIFCDKWANQGLIVEAAGLNGTYQRSEFPVISQLIPIAEEVHKKSAVCRETGNDANFTYRTSNDVGDIVVGGSDKYKPVDRKTFFGSSDSQSYALHEAEMFMKFVVVYCKKHNITLSDTDIHNAINYFNNNRKLNECYIDNLKRFIEIKNNTNNNSNNN